MDTNDGKFSERSKHRKNALISAPKLIDLAKESPKSVRKDETIRPRTRSLNTPPTWQTSMLDTPKASLHGDKKIRKFSENLPSQRTKSGKQRKSVAASPSLSNKRVMTNSRRTKSLVHNNRSEISIDANNLLRHRAHTTDGTLQRPISAFPFVGGYNQDEISWSRYWHIARHHEGTFKGWDVEKDALKRLNKESIKARFLKVSAGRFPATNPGNSDQTEQELALPMMELSLEERLEKIERERGLFNQLTRKT